MELEYLLALHRKYLEELKIIKTFKYSSIIGIILAGISKDLISVSLKVEGIILIMTFIFIIYIILDNQEQLKQENLKAIENRIQVL